MGTCYIRKYYVWKNFMRKCCIGKEVSFIALFRLFLYFKGVKKREGERLRGDEEMRK